MARPRTISDEQILEAARRVFLRDGPAASAAAVAREAGVSEGTVFKRFPTKDALFQGAMTCPGPAIVSDLAARVGEGEVREQLVAVCLELIEGLRRIVPRLMTLAAHGSFNPEEFWRCNPEAPPLVALRELTNYLDAEMRRGRIRLADPEVIGRAILGSAHNYVFLEHLGLHARMPIAAPTFARGFVDVLWSGLTPAQDSIERG